MPSSYTPNLRLTLPSAGEDASTWGDLVNTGIPALIDASIAGLASVSMTAADRTLSIANGSTDEARQMLVSLTGTPGASYNVIVPTATKLYFVKNGTGFAQTVKTAAGTGISVPNGAVMVLFCDGVNVLEAITAAPSVAAGKQNTLVSGTSIKTINSTSLLASGDI